MNASKVNSDEERKLFSFSSSKNKASFFLRNLNWNFLHSFVFDLAWVLKNGHFNDKYLILKSLKV